MNRYKKFQYQAVANPPPQVTPDATSVFIYRTTVIFNKTTLYQSVAYTAFTSEEITVDKWFEALSERVLGERRAAEYLSYTTAPIQPQSNDQIGWYRPLSEPKKLSKSRATDFPAFTYGADPIVNTVDEWWQNLSTPPKAESRAIEYQAFAFSYFVEQAEVVTVDKWFNPLSERLVKSKLRTADFPAFTYGATPIVNNVDQWWQNFATPPKSKPRATDFPATAYGADPIVSNVDRWWQNLATPPKTRPRTAEYPAFAYGADPIVSTPDRWWQNLPTPPKAKARTIEYQSLAFSYFVEQAEIVTVDKWFEELSKPQKLTKDRTVEFPAFTYGATPIVNTPDQWWQNFAVPPKARLRAAEYPVLAFTSVQPQASDFNAGWFRPLSEPRKLSRERATDFPAFTYGAAPIVSTPDRWWGNLATPPKAKARTVDYNASFTPPYQLTPTDFTVGWWRQLSEPYPSKRGLKTALQQSVAFVPGGVLEEVTVDKWYRPYIDPKKLSKARATDFPAVFYGALPIVSTPDRWWNNLATPPKTKSRTVQYPFTANFPIQPQARDQIAWYNPWLQPKRIASGQRFYEQRSDFLPPFAETVTLDKWYVSFNQPKRHRFGLPYSLQRSNFLVQAGPFVVYRPYAMGYIIT